MSRCMVCGADGQTSHFCVNCGAPMTPMTPAPIRSRRSLAIMAAITVAVMAIAGLTYFLVSRPPTSTAGVPVPAPASSTQPVSTGSPSTGQSSPAVHSQQPIPPVSTAPGSPGPSSSTAPPTGHTATSRPSTTKPTPPPDPMGGSQVAIACHSGYFVQVASELTQPAFVARVAAVRAAGLLPGGAKWTRTATGCPLFSATHNSFVLYAGPFGTPYAACPARLASPPDALIRTTDPADKHQFISCLCPANIATLPGIQTGSPKSVWIGELQAVLRSPKIGQPVDDIDPAAGRPSAWGSYSAGTESAVQKFQQAQRLPATGVVDSTTWAYLQSIVCTA